MPSSANAKGQSIWDESVDFPVCPPLSHDLDTDVCIIGAGIAGLTTAQLLTEAGKRVAVLDDGTLAGGATLVTTAHLSCAIDDRFVNIERWHGDDGAKLAARSHAAAINFIESTANELNVDCDFRRIDGYLFLAPGDQQKTLDDELLASRRAGLADAKFIPELSAGATNLGPALRYPDQARFHPLKYLAAVAHSVKQNGGHIFAQTHADGIEGGRAAKVTVGKHTITTKDIVVATNVPVNDLFAIHTKQAPYMSYVTAARVPRGTIPDALYWDTEPLYHYARLQPLKVEGKDDDDFQLLIVGGEDHKSGQASDTERRHAQLELWARERFPSMGAIEFTWGGQYMETIDGLAFIGRNPMDHDNVYVITGDSGMGLTHGVFGGMILRDLIVERENPWVELYDPSRKTIRAGGNFIKENANVAMQYADWLTSGEVRSIDDIELGSGAILRQGLTKVAVYRDEQGHATKLSAVCPHLQCIVHWNGAEKTWDCPCHGSRFQKDGTVIYGPANSDLPRHSQ